ncbi:hypothetical protein D1872_319720 [compost metagenome]
MRLNFRLGIRLSKDWLAKVQVASISLHNALARSTSKPTILLFASIDSNGGYEASVAKRMVCAAVAERLMLASSAAINTFFIIIFPNTSVR